MSPQPQTNLFVPRHVKVYILLIAIMLAIALIGQAVAGQTTGEASTFFIQSRFMLWDSAEKMLDPSFTVHIWAENYSSMNFYNITLDHVHTTGTFSRNVSVPFNLVNTSRIAIFTIAVNNVTLMTANNVVISGGVSKQTISTGSSLLNLISMSPFEWTQAEWNIFFTVFLGGCLAVVIAYRSVKKYKVFKGVKVIK